MEIDWLVNKTEGQFFERKSCYDRSTGTAKRRDPKLVARNVAETLSAMANADGGTLVLGIEDDGTVTGLDFPGDSFRLIKQAPTELVIPPLKASLKLEELEGKQIAIFDVDWSSYAHQLADGRYLYRRNDMNIPFSAADIEALKISKRRKVAEMRFVLEASIDDIDPILVANLARQAGLTGSTEEVLLQYRLAEQRGSGVALTLAALLLFGKEPDRWQPRAGIDFVRYEGTERRYGAALNIVKRERLETPLVRLIEDAYRAVQPHIRERQQLVDLFFEERLEYPPFAWQEAIVNAVAHRDYAIEGLSIEIWMFDDKIEIRSPGELVEPVTLERLRNRERIHASRNPRIVRVLTDLGYMREQGEGVPRIFDAMEHEGLYPPEFLIEGGSILTVRLKNTPVYSVETMKWLAQFDGLGLKGNQKRILAYAREHGDTFTNRAYQQLVHVDKYTASLEIRDLVRKQLIRLPQRRGRVYELVPNIAKLVVQKPIEYLALEPILAEKSFIQNQDIRQVLNVSERTALRIAQRLVAAGWLRLEGEVKGRRYLSAR